jgi:hypothetical protein
MHPTVRLLSFVASILLAAAAIPALAVPTDACSVLTSAQVSSALGSTVANGTYDAPGFTKTCTWTIPTGGAVSLQLQTLDFFNAGKGALASMERDSSHGVGDESYYLGAGSMTGLAVRKGNAAFRIHVYSGKLTAEQVKAIEKTLAQEALSKF